MRRNIFYNELKDYVGQYHPQLLDNKDFLESRSELALETFIDSSKNGFNMEDSKEEANLVLYSGLHFSAFTLIEDIIDEEFPKLLFIDKDKFARQMFEMLLPVIEGYKIGDDFERTSKYNDLYNELTGYIDEYIKRNELQ